MLIINVSRAYCRSCFVWQSQLFINGVPWLCSPRPWAERGAGSGHNREGKHSECWQSTYTFWAESTPPSSSSRNKNALLHVFLINTFHTPVVLRWGFSSHSVTRPWPPRVKCEGSVKVYLYVCHLKGLENPFDFKLPSSPTNYTYFRVSSFKKIWKRFERQETFSNISARSNVYQNIDTLMKFLILFYLLTPRSTNTKIIIWWSQTATLESDIFNLEMIYHEINVGGSRM